MKKRKCESFFLGHGFQTSWRVIRKSGRIIGADGYHADVLSRVIFGKLGNAFLHVLHVRAVTAENHDQEGFLAGKVARRDLFSGYNVGKTEGGCFTP